MIFSNPVFKHRTRIQNLGTAGNDHAKPQLFSAERFQIERTQLVEKVESLHELH